MVSPAVVARSLPRLSSIDLNLLLALEALLHTGSVTAAGRRIGLSQPAMSHALARLREMLGDPLLVREGRTMRRTALAERILPRLRELLTEIESTLLGHRRFTPAESVRSFRIATNDYCGALLLPALLAIVRRSAPRADLEFHAYRGYAPAHELALGELDLAIGVFLHVDPALAKKPLFSDGFACVVRRGNPRVGKTLTLERYVELDHALITSPDYGPGVVDLALAARGLRRRVVARVPHFLVAPALVAKSDLILTLPERVARMASRMHGLRLLAPPLELTPFEVQMVWHARSEPDAASIWLRARVGEAAKRLPRV
jgi:DNA-binding transcriptional LysR family regulator